MRLGYAAMVTATICIALVAGCAWSTDAMMIGPDTYRVSANAAPARGGVTGALGIAHEKATEKCQSLGKRLVVTETKTEYQPWPPNGIANVTFRCE
jgi:ABC-type uncharacterized transport system auxiliary subunit